MIALTGVITPEEVLKRLQGAIASWGHERERLWYYKPGSDFSELLYDGGCHAQCKKCAVQRAIADIRMELLKKK